MTKVAIKNIGLPTTNDKTIRSSLKVTLVKKSLEKLKNKNSSV